MSALNSLLEAEKNEKDYEIKLPPLKVHICGKDVEIVQHYEFPPDADARALLQAAATKQGWELVTCSSSTTRIRLVCQAKPDYVLPISRCRVFLFRLRFKCLATGTNQEQTKKLLGSLGTDLHIRTGLVVARPK